jgi:integrase
MRQIRKPGFSSTNQRASTWSSRITATEYIERARLAEAGRAPLFQAIRYRAFGRGEAVLNGERLHRANAWTMVRRRAKAASITTEVCNHTFRGTGITAYLENGDTLQKAARLHKLQPRREPVSSMPEAISTAR